MGRGRAPTPQAPGPLRRKWDDRCFGNFRTREALRAPTGADGLHAERSGWARDRASGPERSRKDDASDLYKSSGLVGCRGQLGCGNAASTFINELASGTLDGFLFNLCIGVLYLAPALIGIFWGAPLITRELEANTFRPAWTQSITRSRWIAVKLAAIGLATMATAGLLSLMTSWWAGPVDRALPLGGGDVGKGLGAFGTLSPLLFGARGIAPVGYAAFAFALGVTAGVLIRRTLPAMAVTAGSFAFVQLAWPNWIRPHLITPLTKIAPIIPAKISGIMISTNHMRVTVGVNLPGAWILSRRAITPTGRTFTGPVPRACHTQGIQACNAAIGRLHLRQIVTYQPASRFWQFQWYETAIFFAAALALAAFSFWWVRRRLT